MPLSLWCCVLLRGCCWRCFFFVSLVLFSTLLCRCVVAAAAAAADAAVAGGAVVVVWILCIRSKKNSFHRKNRSRVFHVLSLRRILYIVWSSVAPLHFRIYHVRLFFFYPST